MHKSNNLLQRKGNEMLNKCKCGSDAKLKQDFDGNWFVECCATFCFRGVDGDDSRDAIGKWNNPPPAPVTPPEDFEKRLIKSIVWLDLRRCDDPNHFLRSFESNFGFDLREVAREQWAKGVRNGD